MTCPIVFFCLCWDALGMAQLSPLPPGPKKDPTRPIKLEDYSKLTFSKAENYRMGDRPFIVTGIPAKQSPCFGGLGAYNDSFLLNHCRGKIKVNGMADPAQIRKSTTRIGEMQVHRFLRYFSREGGGSNPVFAEALFIPRACPKLWLHARIPAYFSGQLGQFQAEVYFSKAGFRQSFHIDKKPAELWIAMCRGRKRYRVVPRSVVWKSLGRAVDPQLDDLLMRPADWPLGMPVWEGVASAGDLVYIPAGAIHAVDTIEDTVSIVNDFLYVGHLGRTSRVNKMLAPRLRLDEIELKSVFDGSGHVTDPNFTARGFASVAEMYFF